MRKAVNNNKRFPRKVRFRGKIRDQSPCDDHTNEPPMIEDSSSAKEIEALKEQISGLRTVIASLHLDNDNKEAAIGKLAREKEKLQVDLHKIKRCHTNLNRQLEDERHFYFEEKELYVHEMNEFKRLKQALSNTNISLNNVEELEATKKKLEQALQTNYNLSLKFLKIRERTFHLKNILKQVEEDRLRTVDDFKNKINNLTNELELTVNEKFNAPMSPSNRKYLKLVQQNSSLVYENLCLQYQVDHLKVKCKKLKLWQTKSETSPLAKLPSKNDANKYVRTNSDKLKRPKEKIVKLFEKDDRPGLPTVTILNERELYSNNRTNKWRICSTNESKLTVFQVSELQSKTSTGMTNLMGIPKKYRSRSAPKIVQSVSFLD